MRSVLSSFARSVRPVRMDVKNQRGQSSPGTYVTRVARSPTAKPMSPPTTRGTGKKPPMMQTASPSNRPLTVQIRIAGQRGSVTFGSFLTRQQ